MNTEKNILDNATNLFMQYGLKSVTMDDIAGKSGVSKKTIYQFFKDKNDIIKSSIKDHFEKHRQNILEAINSTKTATEALVELSSCMKKQVEAINPAVLYDLQKYYPKSYQKVVEFKQEFMLDLVINMLNKGVDDGTFRKEIDVEILAIMRIEQVQFAFNPTIFPRDKFDFKTVNYQMFEHFVYGILTEKGRKQYYKLISEHEI